MCIELFEFNVLDIYDIFDIRKKCRNEQWNEMNKTAHFHNRIDLFLDRKLVRWQIRIWRLWGEGDVFVLHSTLGRDQTQGRFRASLPRVLQPVQLFVEKQKRRRKLSADANVEGDDGGIDGDFQEQVLLHSKKRRNSFSYPGSFSRLLLSLHYHKVSIEFTSFPLNFISFFFCPIILLFFVTSQFSATINL